MIDLPDANELFLRYLDPWYTDEERRTRSHPGIRPDLLLDRSLAGRDPKELAPADTELALATQQRIEAICSAARVFWPQMLGVSGEPDVAWIEAFDAHFDRAEVRAVIERSNPADRDNEYVRLCTEFGAVLANVLLTIAPKLVWWASTPLWETALLDAAKGITIPTFHWAVKKMSDPGVDDGMTGKIMVCMGQVLE